MNPTLVAILLVVPALLGPSVAPIDPRADARYYVSAGPCSGSWSDANCWSAVNGGPGGAGIPTENTAVFFTAASGDTSVVATLDQPATVISVAFITSQVSTRLQLHAALSVERVIAEAVTDATILIDPNGVLVFTDEIEGEQANFLIAGDLLGAGRVRYAGPNSTGTIEGARLRNVDASGGPAIRCFGCADEGANVNILFEAPDRPEAPGVSLAPIAIAAAIAAVGIAVVVWRRRRRITR